MSYNMTILLTSTYYLLIGLNCKPGMYVQLLKAVQLLQLPRNMLSVLLQVFPVDIENEAKERAWKRHPAQSPHFNKVS